MKSFADEEREFLNSREECRVATSYSDLPHVKPVSYIFENDIFYIATDHDTRMYKNCKSNPKAALTIDIYKRGGIKQSWYKAMLR